MGLAEKKEQLREDKYNKNIISYGFGVVLNSTILKIINKNCNHLIVFLFLLAVFDLSVGVSNDAVNFLNSAMGSKAAPLKHIIIIASIGIFIGAENR